MNSAPAELLQLLTIAALQLLSARPALGGTVKTWLSLAASVDQFDFQCAAPAAGPALYRKEKAANPESIQVRRLAMWVKGLGIYKWFSVPF
jgi:hypothetical protein